MMITILDGGMGGEIARRMKGAGKGLWSAKALTEEPDVVRQVHQDYIDAGARIIITNTYSTIPSYLEKEGMQGRMTELADLAGRIAREVADAAAADVQVAGSIPPLSESYRPDLVPSADDAAPVYEKLVSTLVPHVDFFICETMSSIAESINATDAVLRFGEGRPVYLSWTLDETPGEGLRSGESVAEAFAAVSDHGIAGYSFNYTTPEAVCSAIADLRPLTDKPIGCYANRIERVPEGWTLDNDLQYIRRNDLTTEYFVHMGRQCVDAGANFIGGCCGIGPAEIRALAEALAED